MTPEPDNTSLAIFDTAGGRRLRDLVNSDTEARAAFYAFNRESFAEYQTECLLLMDRLDDDERERQFTSLIDRMAATADSDERERLIEAGRKLFDTEHLRHRCRRLLRRVHRVHFKDQSDNAAAALIAMDLARRFGTTIISTGNKNRDVLIDEIILCCARPGMERSIPSSRSIRRSLAPG